MRFCYEQLVPSWSCALDRGQASTNGLQFGSVITGRAEKIVQFGIRKLKHWPAAMLGEACGDKGRGPGWPVWYTS